MGRNRMHVQHIAAIDIDHQPELFHFEADFYYGTRRVDMHDLCFQGTEACVCPLNVEFVRPNDVQRSAVLEGALKEAGLSAKQIAHVVSMTGSRAPGDAGFTYSDLTQRLLPTLVLDAYPSKAIHYDRVIELVTDMKPTPPFKDA